MFNLALVLNKRGAVAIALGLSLLTELKLGKMLSEHTIEDEGTIAFSRHLPLLSKLLISE